MRTPQGKTKRGCERRESVSGDDGGKGKLGTEGTDLLKDGEVVGFVDDVDEARTGGDGQGREGVLSRGGRDRFEGWGEKWKRRL